MIKKFLENPSFGDRKKDSFIWNMGGGLLSAFQSVIYLVFVSRILGLEESGILSIAFANANLFANIGRYGVRNFQVTDTENRYSFSEYMGLRVLTSIIMVITFTIYLLYTGITRDYTTEKLVIILALCLSKLLDSFEDVYYGYLQNIDRLDIGAKILTLRLLVVYISFVLILVFNKDLIIAITGSTILSALVVIISLRSIKQDGFCPSWSFSLINKENIKQILKSCFPLFLGTFLAFYIGNAPKYAIDSLMDEETQACFAFISMPVFVINLLNSFVFQPILNKLAVEWNTKKYKEFIHNFILENIIILVITVVVVIGGKLIGIWALEIIYNTPLKIYENEFIYLLVGGGFLAYSGFYVSILTVMRKQKITIYAYMIVSILAYIGSPILVNNYNTLGASLLYFSLMGILAVACLVPIIIEIKNVENN